MAAVMIRNLSDSAHRALKARAAQNHRSAEAEMRDILETAARPHNRLRLGTAIAEISWKFGLTDDDIEALDEVRDRKPAEPMRLMILLDTNVVSEAMRRTPDPAVRNWLDEQVVETLYLSSVSIAELLFGIETLPAGKRRDRLAASLNEVLPLFADRILPFDENAARRYAELAVAARSMGKGFPAPDGYIAAIAAARRFAVASRDTSAFEAAGLTIIDPWKTAI